MKDFITRSFNSLSSSIVRAALKKPQQSHRSSTSSLMDTPRQQDSKLLECLSQSVTSQSRIVMLCCVSPSQASYEHSLPAIKFCARIRDCIVKRLKKVDNENHHKSTGLEEIKGIIEQIRVETKLQKSKVKFDN